MSSKLLFTETPSLKRAVDLINELDDAKFPSLIARIVQKLHLRDEKAFSDEEEAKLQAVLGLEAKDLELILETAAFFLEQAAYYSSKPTILNQQLQKIHLSDTKAAAIVKAWSTTAKDVLDRLKQKSFYPKQLDDVNWRLNLQMGQSTKSKTKIPNALFEFDVKSDGEGQDVERVRTEFTHEELFSFYKQLETVQDQLDSLS
ncbi:COMM domain-containing protein 10-like [Oscarella lobularis]|uniref:COMM domain-containing protein 10-like n=1 Tax=Oscarella lobularis TaxID=121494 RepID=UPI0033133884